MMHKNDRIQNIAVLLTQVIVVFVLWLFFVRINPVIPYDGDDWYFAGAMRWPFPLWGVFNPSKVLPETIEPLCGYIAAYIVYPITGDYIRSLSLVMGLCVALICYLLCWFVYKYTRKTLNITVFRALSIELIVFVSLFLIFKQRTSESYYALWSSDINCCFNYVVPGMLNGIMVLALELHRFCDERKNDSFINGLLLVGVYFAMFSNIELNILLAVYAAVKILIHLLDNTFKTHRMDFRLLIKENSWCIVILFFWVVTLIFEFNGGRAKVVSGESFWAQSFSATFIQMKSFAKNINLVFGFVVVILFISSVVLSEIGAKKNEFDKRIRNALREAVLIGAIVFVYLFLIFTKLGGTYASRPDCMWALQFIAYWLLAISLAEIVSKLQFIRKALPLCILTMCICAFNLNYPFVSCHGGRDYATCKALDEYIIDQIVEADSQGLSYVEVKVPLEQNSSNWPHPYNMAQWMQNTLYAHGIINSRIKVVFVPDPSVNDLFYSRDGVSMEPFTDLEGW